MSPFCPACWGSLVGHRSPLQFEGSASLSYSSGGRLGPRGANMQEVEPVAEVAEAVTAEYGSFTSDNAEGHRQLAQMTATVRDWFNGRSLSQQAAYCIDRYVAAEADYLTPGFRGLGRVGESTPRLAARHRTAFARMKDEEREALKRLIKRHMV